MGEVLGTMLHELVHMEIGNVLSAGFPVLPPSLLPSIPPSLPPFLLHTCLAPIWLSFRPLITIPFPTYPLPPSLFSSLPPPLPPSLPPSLPPALPQGRIRTSSTSGSRR
jgi:hypothetical protein